MYNHIVNENAFNLKERENMKISKTKEEAILARQLLTKMKAAEISGLSSQAFSTILCRGTCSPISAGKIAKGLKVDITELLEN